MTSVLSSSARTEDDLDDDYSFAIEYNGPPINRDIPQVVPIDIRRIPTAAMAATTALLKNFSLPIVQPIVVRSANSSKKSSGELNSIKPELDDDDDDDERGTNDDDERGTNGEISSQEDSREAGQGTRMATVTFQDVPSSVDGVSDESDYDEPDIYPCKQPAAVPGDGKSGSCHKCGKTNRFLYRGLEDGKEFCLVCGAKYCKKCVLRAMGCMPEGRKCITCIGYRIDESKRGMLGKCSKMLNKLLGDEVTRKYMSAEATCEANRLPPHLIFVNGKRLSIEELVSLQSCQNPPKKLRPGKYWYDKLSGFWGKEGEKPSQIISPQLPLGYQIMQDASNGDTNVMINNRKITKPELFMLTAAGINCEGSVHFWVTANGSCQQEGMKNMLGNLWERKRMKVVCATLRLPYPSDTSNLGGGDVDEDTDKVLAKIPEDKTIYKLLLVGCDQSGTSTIFKQAKVVYSVPFSDDEKQDIKFVIQRNVYHYICILLEGRENFEEEFLIERRRQHAEEPGPSDYSEKVDDSNIYSLAPRLKKFSDWLLQIAISGNLEIIFPAATREYSPLVEELWKDKAFQATYKRRNELHTLPRVANYFLDRVVEISQMDYQPSQMDILYAEGFSSSNGVASMEFYFPESSHDAYMEPSDDSRPPVHYELIRVHVNSLGENCKWLTMFDDVDLVIYCASLTDYDEYHEDINGACMNKMLASKNLFETIITHPALADKEFLLILNKYDLLEEKIERDPLSSCDWFQDFRPVISHHPHSAGSNNNPPLAQRAFHYIAVKFKRLFSSLTGRKLFVSRATGLEADTVDSVMKYGREILKWNEEIQNVRNGNEWSSESIERSTST